MVKKSTNTTQSKDNSLGNKVVKGAARKGSPSRSAKNRKIARSKAKVKRAARNKKENLDPKQAKFLSFYLDPKSDTYANALQSALAAGYSQSYAENITGEMPEWLQDNLGELRRAKMVDKAEQNLFRTLDMSVMEVEKDADGNVIRDKHGAPVMYVSEDILRVQHDANKFITETLAKKYYSKRMEQTGADGQPLNVTIVSYADESKDTTQPDNKAVPNTNLEGN